MTGGLKGAEDLEDSEESKQGDHSNREDGSYDEGSEENDFDRDLGVDLGEDNNPNREDGSDNEGGTILKDPSDIVPRDTTSFACDD